MKLFILAILFVGLAVMGIAIKMFFIKGSTFSKTCGSVDPKTGQKVACTCGDDGGGKKSDCDNKRS